MCSKACLPSESLRQSRLSTWQGRPWVPAFRNLRVSPAMYKGEIIIKSVIRHNEVFAVMPVKLAAQLGHVFQATKHNECGKHIDKDF